MSACVDSLRDGNGGGEVGEAMFRLRLHNEVRINLSLIMLDQ